MVTTQLRLSVFRARDHDIVQPQAILQHEHVRMQPQLPARILHLGRHQHLELQVDLAVPLGDVAETRGHHGRIQHLRRHHLSAFLVTDRLHQNHLPAIQVRHADRIPPGRLHVLVFREIVHLPGQLERGRQLPAVHFVRLAAGAAGREQGRRQQERKQVFQRLASHQNTN